MYETILLVVFLVISVAIIGLVLVQNGKGADMGASFGAGASATLFGSSGTGNFLTRTTSILGLLFFVISILLVNLSSATKADKSEFSSLGDDVAIEQTTAPVKSVESTPEQGNNSTSEIPE
jgi:preprotein translocase subunit SecG